MSKSAIYGLAATLAMGAFFSIFPNPKPVAHQGKQESVKGIVPGVSELTLPQSAGGRRLKPVENSFDFSRYFKTSAEDGVSKDGASETRNGTAPDEAALNRASQNGLTLNAAPANGAAPKPAEREDEYQAMAPRGDGAWLSTSIRISRPAPVAVPAALGSLAPGDFYPGAAYAPENRDKGLRLWSGASFHQERAAPAGSRDFGHYRQSGQTYRVGADYDLSVNVVAKASLELSGRKVFSLDPGDNRVGDISVGILSLAGDWLLDERYILSGKAFYGWAGIKTSGEVVLSGSPFSWQEGKRRAGLFGFSGTLSFPLLYGQNFKLSPEIGLELTRVVNPARRGEMFYQNGATPIQLIEHPAGTSTSLAVPATLRMGRDYRKGWGSLSPRLELGLFLELGDSGETAGNFGAGSLMRFDYHASGGGLPTGFKEAAVARYGCLLGAGADLIGNNGWELRADFSLTWSLGRLRNDFRLEGGKCF